MTFSHTVAFLAFSSLRLVSTTIFYANIWCISKSRLFLCRIGKIRCCSHIPNQFFQCGPYTYDIICTFKYEFFALGVNVEHTFTLGLKTVWKSNSLNFCDQYGKISFQFPKSQENFHSYSLLCIWHQKAIWPQGKTVWKRSEKKVINIPKVFRPKKGLNFGL